MTKLKELSYLVALDEHRHFGKAAQACFVSQPTLSGQLIKLEERLGLTLIERHRRKVILTAAGETLAAKAREVLQAATIFEQTAKALLDPLAGDLHIGSIPTLAPYLLPNIMQGLSESLPRINYFLHENKTANLLQDLNDGKLDLLILPLLEGMDKFDHYHLFNEPLLLALPHDHPLNEQKSLQLKDLQGQRVLTLEDGHCLRDQTLGYCFSAGADEDPRFQASSLETLRHMVAAGLGITLIPKLATANTQPSTMIKYRSFSKPEPSREIVILIRQNYPKIQCIQRIVSILRESTKAFNQP